MKDNKNFRSALVDRLLNSDAMASIDDPWRHDGNGAIEDANGVPVAFVSYYHEAQVPLIMAAPKLLKAAIKARESIEALLEDGGNDSVDRCLPDLIAAIIEATQGLQ